MKLSIVIIACDEEENLPRTLRSVETLVRTVGGEIILVDSGSKDRTVEIARSFGAKVYVEAWKGFTAQKNSAIDKATADWVFLLDADEEVTAGLAKEVAEIVQTPPDELSSRATGYWVDRKNLFLGKWLRRAGAYPDPKVRLFRRGTGRVEERAVHEVIKVQGTLGKLKDPLIHYAYPTLTYFIEHMNRYSSLGADIAGPRRFNLVNIYVRPQIRFFYNYIVRGGFLDGAEGFLYHLYHAVYVSWKYAKAWERRKDLLTHR